MDMETLKRAEDLQMEILSVRDAIDAWERMEQPQVPMTSWPSQRNWCLELADKATWLVFRRNSIASLQVKHDELTTQFKRL